MKLLYNRVDQEKRVFIDDIMTKEIFSFELSKNRSTILLMFTLETNSSLYRLI